MVILTNQGGLTLHPDPTVKGPRTTGARVAGFKQKCGAVFSNLGFPLTLYAATANDVFRKPRTGMWEEMRKDYGLAGDDGDVDLANSIFVGDAAGRAAYLKGGVAVPKDFSSSDRNLAHNIGVPYQTPEEFFLGEEPRAFVRGFDLASHPFAADEGGLGPEVFETEGRNVVLFCGPPGAGKSTFYRKLLEPLGYERINQDTLVTFVPSFRERLCMLTWVQESKVLQGGDGVASGGKIRRHRFAVPGYVGGRVLIVSADNTNPDPDTRVQWVQLARKNKAPIRCVWFKTPMDVCEHNNAVRALNESVREECPSARSALTRPR